MGVKLQHNPSPGKISWNALTGKLSVVVSRLPGVCDDCDDPATIDVTIADVITCCAKGTGDSIGITPSIADLFNGTHTLTRIAKCLYNKSLDVTPFGTYKFFDYTDSEACDTTPFSESNIISAGIGVNLLTEPGVYRCDLTLTSSGSGQSLVQRWTDAVLLPCFDQTIDPSIYPVCETGPGDGFLSSYTNILAGGTIVISETP